MKLMLFFSRGISLSIWHKSGLLDRELAPYKIQKRKNDVISLVTYGMRDHELLISESRDFEILNNPFGLPVDLFALLAPFIYRHQIRAATILKTNQINGWWVAGLAKLLFKKQLGVR